MYFLLFFSEYLQSLCNGLYETLRPQIIHINHLETLAELCVILRVEVIEEQVNNDRKLNFLEPKNNLNFFYQKYKIERGIKLKNFNDDFEYICNVYVLYMIFTRSGFIFLNSLPFYIWPFQNNPNLPDVNQKQNPSAITAPSTRIPCLDPLEYRFGICVHTDPDLEFIWIFCPQLLRYILLGRFWI